jgi:hypothetical protein
MSFDTSVACSVDLRMAAAGTYMENSVDEYFYDIALFSGLSGLISDVHHCGVFT